MGQRCPLLFSVGDHRLAMISVWNDAASAFKDEGGLAYEDDPGLRSVCGGGFCFS